MNAPAPTTQEKLAAMDDAQLVGVYRKLREKRDDAKAAFVEKQAPLLEMLREIEGQAKLRLQERGNNSFATDEGTCYTSTVHTFTAKDKSAFLDWIKANDKWELLDVRPAKKEVEAYLEENKELPVGLNSSSKVNTNFTAPRKK